MAEPHRGTFIVKKSNKPPPVIVNKKGETYTLCEYCGDPLTRNNRQEHMALHQADLDYWRHRKDITPPDLRPDSPPKGKGISTWIQHVKTTRAEHGCYYKQAMSLASKTWHK